MKLPSGRQTVVNGKRINTGLIEFDLWLDTNGVITPTKTLSPKLVFCRYQSSQLNQQWWWWLAGMSGCVHGQM